MEVTIIGMGNMARGIATRFLAGDHNVTLAVESLTGYPPRSLREVFEAQCSNELRQEVSA